MKINTIFKYPNTQMHQKKKHEIKGSCPREGPLPNVGITETGKNGLRKNCQHFQLSELSTFLLL